ncbi:MAG: hypothetical protein Q7T16_05205 [Candidatus Burarchaeum sp.]|nr:radical SAM protein [Candidatus Burarchaeum sp.]MDO8340027.1 hypothetical protein [Candidatus Burarchaeum sp.]
MGGQLKSIAISSVITGNETGRKPERGFDRRNLPSIDLIQPRHNHARDPSIEPLGQVYMPTSLLTAGARLLEAGVDVSFHDENIMPYRPSANPDEPSAKCVGINLLGAPYIPEAIRLMEKIGSETGNTTYLLGGQVISGLTQEQFTALFGESAYNGNVDVVLSSVLGIDPAKLIPPEKTSLIPAYEKIPDDVMKEYLSREFSLYVSQGCKFACNFCAAVRTVRDPRTSKVVRKVRETYRDIETIGADLSYLVNRAKRLGISELQIYMSNLDVFQTPAKLLEFAHAVQAIRAENPGFGINLRGLATVESFLQARDNGNGVIGEMAKAGFHSVGFGVDGMTAEVWKAVNKGINSEDKCLEAIRSSREDFGITPEILMVFGHVGADTEASLTLAYEFTLGMVRLHGAVPRPHVSKSFIPGNNGWDDPLNAGAVASLIANPEAFQALDFTALPSPLTHPSSELRELSTEYYLKICGIPESTTLHVRPITPDMTPEELAAVRSFNEGRYDH